MSSLRLGEIQTLEIVKKVEFGVYLASSKETQEERVLLPRRLQSRPERVARGFLLRRFHSPWRVLNLRYHPGDCFLPHPGGS